MSSNLHPVKSHKTQYSTNQVLEQLSSVLIGKEQQVKLSLCCLIAGGHLLIEDVPGVGKTTLAQTLGVTLGLDSRRIQFTGDLLPADIIGVSIYNSTTQEFNFTPGPIFTSIVLADEVNRAPPRAQSALLQAMEEREISVDGKTRKLPDPFFVIATQNAADQIGAYPLPESQLDRFLAGIELGYPDQNSERQLLKTGDKRSSIQFLSALADAETLQNWRQSAIAIHCSDAILDYTLALLQATRSDQFGAGMQGLSPRAGLGLLNMARAWAKLDGRSMVVPEDLQTVFPSVAGHRLTGSVGQGKHLCSEILEQVALP